MFKKLLVINKKEHSVLFSLALPMMLSELIFSSDNFFNNLFAARLGHAELAAQALLSLLFFVFSAAVWGLFSGAGVLIAHNHGANKPDNIRQILQQGIVLSVLLSIVLSVIIWHAPSIFILLGQNPQLAELSRGYAHVLAIATFGLNFYSISAEFLIGTSRAKIIFWLSIVETPVNIFLKYSLIFGKFGFPRVGLSGLGWGIGSVIWGTDAVMILYFLFAKSNAKYCLWQWQKQQWCLLKDAIKTGWPVAALLAEEIAFLFVFSLLMGKISVSTLAANQIALQFSGFFGVLAWGLGQATTARTGNKLGEKNEAHAKLSGITGLQLNFMMMGIVALLLILFPHAFIAIDFANPHTQLSNEAALFLRVSAVYLLLNNTRIMANCCLRAYQDTYYSFIISVVILWFIALPLGYFLLFHANVMPTGMWIAAIVGELIGSVLLLRRFLRKVNI